MSTLLRIGARGSPLSLAQTARVQARLAQLMGVVAERIEIAPIATTGDRIQDRTLSEAGGKGLFTKELDEALLAGRIDLAVHSAKDLPTFLPEGVVFACTPEREDPRDALLAREARRLADLPPGAVVGTASLRRQAQTLYARPDLVVRPMRGNVATRIAKLESGEAAATFLALAGLKRLGLERRIGGLIDPEEAPPAIGQGALAVTARAGDARVLAALGALEDAKARLEIEAERGVLEALDGSCRTPIAALARAEEGALSLLAEALTPDGARRWRQSGRIEAPTRDSARALGLALGAAIRREAGDLLHTG